MQLLLPYPVTLQVACRTSPEPTASATRHEVTLEMDGSVTTPHDLDAERVAVALGGFCSCLDLVERAVPAFRDWLAAHLREQVRPVTSKDEGATWFLPARGRCCRWHGWERPEDAAAHGRDPGHHAAVHDADPRQVRALVKAAAVPEPVGPGPRHEPWTSAWRCGLPADRVSHVAAQVPCREELPVEFHLAVAAKRPDLGWIAATLAECGGGDARMAVWLAWSQQPDDRRDARLRASWLRPGIPARAVLPLQRAGYTPADVARLARAWGRTDPAIATVLLGWVEHGYRPDVDDLLGPRLRHLADPPLAPARAMVERLRRALGPGATAVSDTDLAVALVRHGTVWHAQRALPRSG